MSSWPLQASGIIMRMASGSGRPAIAAFSRVRSSCPSHAATTMVATFRCNRDIAIGNLIGSSTYNVTFILGTSLLFARGPVTVDPELITVDLPVMVAAALVCLPIFLTGRRVTRVEGVLMVLAYAAYLAYLIIVRA